MNNTCNEHKSSYDVGVSQKYIYNVFVNYARKGFQNANAQLLRVHAEWQVAL